ncbi:hypothetical protein MMC25_001809 [Agyrium rufum]|nr:hypothetical protein [Agyrium rufum]
MAETTTAEKPTIVLIHGLWMNSLCWELWIQRFESAGHTAIAPAWPSLENRSVADINHDPSVLHGLDMATIVDHHAGTVEKISPPPILMGHSFGGLFVEMLLARGLGAAGIALDPAQPADIHILSLSTVRSSFPVLGNPFTYNAVVPLTPKEFNYAFTNELTAEESQAVYERYHIPAAAHVLWQPAFGIIDKHGAGAVDFAKQDRAPLLLVAESKDHVCPPATQKATWKRYQKHVVQGKSVVDLKEFEGRTHHTIGQKGWEEVADYALEWAKDHVKQQS